MTASLFRRVQISGGLVGQQHERLSCHSARHSDALLLAAGKLAGQVPGSMGHADLLQGFVHAMLALGSLHAAIGERKFDVFVDSQIADQIEALKDESDLTVSNACPLLVLEAFHGLAVEQVAAFGRRVKQPEQRQQC